MDNETFCWNIFKETTGSLYCRFKKSTGGKIKGIKRYKASECIEIPWKKGSEEDKYLRIDFEWIKELLRKSK
ncbi:hypothetical protein [Clostridium sp. C2-6-12]|uniref:hypothetical protein n=1 Tax=Clostridium sp. C2-6-12 TaxID=2698832 RepID=UPI001A9B6A91|nr:hypothetical protein [Clostridium sp. C2-6-12]